MSPLLCPVAGCESLVEPEVVNDLNPSQSVEYVTECHHRVDKCDVCGGLRQVVNLTSTFHYVEGGIRRPRGNLVDIATCGGCDPDKRVPDYAEVVQ